MMSSGKGSGPGDLSFQGESVPNGNGILAGNVTSPSISCASWYSGLVCLDLEGLTGLKLGLLLIRYGSWRYQPLPPLLCPRNPGGDHGSPLLEDTSGSDSSWSDLKPECWEGKSNKGERFGCSSKSSSDAVNEG